MKQYKTSDSNFYEFTCPHCNISIIVMKNEMNCRIFRCGEYKKTRQPIPPHLPKNLCDELVKNDLIYGCGKPFIFKNDKLEICDYI